VAVNWGEVFAIAGGVLAGFLSGTIGSGGGLLFVPIMTLGFRMAQPIAQGTSLAAVIPTAIVGGITHIRQGNVLREVAIWMGVGGVGGALIGSLVAVEVPEQILARGFGLFLLFSAYRLASQALGKPKTAQPR
jgi:uncharacterized membrane protein YfcA